MDCILGLAIVGPRTVIIRKALKKDKVKRDFPDGKRKKTYWVLSDGFILEVPVFVMNKETDIEKVRVALYGQINRVIDTYKKEHNL